MLGMFEYANAVKQDIGRWDVSQVTHSDMHAAKRDQSVERNSPPIYSCALVAQVKFMFNMFSKAYAFNQNIGSWDVSQVTHSGMPRRETSQSGETHFPPVLCYA